MSELNQGGSAAFAASCPMGRADNGMFEISYTTGPKLKVPGRGGTVHSYNVSGYLAL